MAYCCCRRKYGALAPSSVDLLTACLTARNIFGSGDFLAYQNRPARILLSKAKITIGAHD